MNVFRWPLAGLLIAISVSTQAADPAAVYGKGGANPAAMARVSVRTAAQVHSRQMPYSLARMAQDL